MAPRGGDGGKERHSIAKPALQTWPRESCSSLDRGAELPGCDLPSCLLAEEVPVCLTVTGVGSGVPALTAGLGGPSPLTSSRLHSFLLARRLAQAPDQLPVE